MIVQIYFNYDDTGNTDDSFVIEAETDDDLRQKTIAFFDARGMSIERNYIGSREL